MYVNKYILFFTVGALVIKKIYPLYSTLVIFSFMQSFSMEVNEKALAKKEIEQCIDIFKSAIANSHKQERKDSSDHFVDQRFLDNNINKHGNQRAELNHGLESDIQRILNNNQVTRLSFCQQLNIEAPQLATMSSDAIASLLVDHYYRDTN